MVKRFFIDPCWEIQSVHLINVEHSEQQAATCIGQLQLKASALVRDMKENYAKPSCCRQQC